MIDLPRGWIRVRLDEIAEVRLGRQRSPKNHTGSQMRPYLRAANVTWDGLSLNDVNEMNFTDAEVETYKLELGDIVLSEASGSPSEVGKPALWNNEIPDCCFQNTLLRVRPRGVDPQYIHLFLKFTAIRGGFAEESRGVGIHHLGAARLAALPVAVPPLTEQRRLVVVLEDYLSHLAAGQRTLGRVESRIAALHAASLDYFVSGRATSSESTFDPMETLADALAELAGARPKKIDYGSLLPLPRGWRWCAAAEVCESVFSGSTPEARLMHAGSGDIPFLKVYNISRTAGLDPSIRPTFIDRSTHEGPLRRSRVRPGDVLTNIVGPPLGKVAIVPATHDEWNINQAIVAFRSGSRLEPGWLAAALRSNFVLGRLEATAKATAGQFNIALSACRELPIPVPPKSVQIELLERIGDLTMSTRLLGALVAQTSARAPHLKQTLLQMGFSGRLVAQDSNDEPAIALLERIGAEQGSARRRGRRIEAAEQRNLEFGL